jgi:hypothetical protein
MGEIKTLLYKLLEKNGSWSNLIRKYF